METKLNVLLLAAQALLNLYSKGTPPADADTKMAGLLQKARLVRELGIEHPLADAFRDRVKELAALRAWKELDP